MEKNLHVNRVQNKDWEEHDNSRKKKNTTGEIFKMKKERVMNVYNIGLLRQLKKLSCKREERRLLSSLRNQRRKIKKTPQ